jgi:hypothetical protein
MALDQPPGCAFRCQWTMSCMPLTVFMWGLLDALRTLTKELAKSSIWTAVLCPHVGLNWSTFRWTELALLKKAGNLRRGKVENCQAFVLGQPQLSLPNQWGWGPQTGRWRQPPGGEFDGFPSQRDRPTHTDWLDRAFRDCLQFSPLDYITYDVLYDIIHTSMISSSSWYSVGRHTISYDDRVWYHSTFNMIRGLNSILLYHIWYHKLKCHDMRYDIICFRCCCLCQLPQQQRPGCNTGYTEANLQPWSWSSWPAHPTCSLRWLCCSAAAWLKCDNSSGLEGGSTGTLN